MKYSRITHYPMFQHAIFSHHGLGQMRSGVEKTPRILSTFFTPHIKKHVVKNNNNLVQNLKSLYIYNDSFHGKRINVGGDHSMTIATGAYSLNKYSNTKFIWIDAHADINSPESSESSNYHGMPLNFLTGMTKTNLFYFIRNKLRFDNILYIGVRSIDPYEQQIIKRYDIPVIRSQMCNTNIHAVMEYIRIFCNNSPVHLSFDVDSVDPFYIPSTGTPVKKGLSRSTATTLLKYINENTDIINMDFCELNLDIGSNRQRQKSLDNALSILRPLELLK